MPHEVYDMLKPANDQNFPIVNAIDIKGGIHYAAKLKDLYNIKEDKLLQGMLCYVNETNKTYIYKAKAITNPDKDHPLYAYDKEEWQEFCDGKCFTVKGSILSLEVPPDVSTLIIKNDDVEHKPANEGEEINPEVYRFITTIIPYVKGQTIKIINMNEEPISISGTIDTPGKAAVVHETRKDDNATIVTKYKLVTSYDYNSDNLLRTSFYQNKDGSIKVYYDVDENGKGITKTDDDGNILFDANKYNPEGWFLLPSYDKGDCRERRIKFLRYDGIINLNKNESITLQHIEGKYWIDIDSNISNKTNDIFESTIFITSKDEEGNDVKIEPEPDYRHVISTQRKLKTIKLNTNCTLVRVSNINTEVDSLDKEKKNFDEDYFGNRLPCDNYKEGDIITIIPTVKDCSIRLYSIDDDFMIGSFVGEKHESKIELVKDSINQFVYTKCGTFTGYLLDRDENGNVQYDDDTKKRKVLTEDKYVWKKLTSTTVDKPTDVIELDAGILSDKTGYSITIYENTEIVHMNKDFGNTETKINRLIKCINDENLDFYPEFLFINDIGTRELTDNEKKSNLTVPNVGDTRIYTGNNIDISNIGLNLISSSYYIIPRGLCIKFKYNAITKKWESIEHFYDETNNYKSDIDLTTVTINVEDVMTDNTVNVEDYDNEYVKQWIEGYKGKDNNHYQKQGRQYFCWYKDIFVDGRTKNVVFDLKDYIGLAWARRYNEARGDGGYQLPSILQISSIVKDPNSVYDLVDGQEITFSMKEDPEKSVYFSLHFVHANTAFPISYPNSYYRNMFKIKNTDGKSYTDIPKKYNPNIILKSNESSSSGVFSTKYIYLEKKEKEGTANEYEYTNNYSNAKLDLPLEVPDIIIRTSADYNNSDFSSINDIEKTNYNTKRSKLSTVTFKYNKARNLWFECRREISPYDCRKVVALPLYKDKGNAKYLKKSVFIDPETEVLLVNSEFPNIDITNNENTDNVEKAKRFVTIANINLGNFDFLTYYFLTTNDKNRFEKYDSYYRKNEIGKGKKYETKDDFVQSELTKCVFHSSGYYVDASGKKCTYSDGQKDSIYRMMKRMHISCLGKKLTIVAINPTRLLSFYSSPNYDPSNLVSTNKDIFVYTDFGTIMNDKKFNGKAYDPAQALRYVESGRWVESGIKDIHDGSILNYDYFNSTIMQDWCWYNSTGLIELKNNKAIELILQGTNWVPTSEEYSITDQDIINAGEDARADIWKIENLSNENN